MEKRAAGPKPLQNSSFDKTISKPVGASHQRKSVGTSHIKSRQAGVRLSNSFEAIGQIRDEAVDEVELRTPVTFLDLFEQVLLSGKDKGKEKVGEYGKINSVERVFPPTLNP